MKQAIIFFFAVLCFTIIKSQNVGIGIAIPTSTLHVFGSTVDTKVETNNAFGRSVITIKSPGGTNDYLQLIKNGASASGTTAGISLSNLSQVFAGAEAGGLLIGAATNSPLYFTTNGAERMRITGNGNIGINVTNPLWPLHIASTNTYTTWMENTNGGSGYGMIALRTGGPGAGLGAVAGTVGEILAGYEVGSYALLGTTGAATAIGAFSEGGTSIRARSMSGLTLHTTGNLRFTGISEGPNKVLTSDATGNATWQTMDPNPQIGFSAILSGNQSTTPSVYNNLVSFLEAYDNGNNFNNTTGIFTAPSAGIYHFDATVFWQSPPANTTIWVQFLFNGGTVPGSVSSTVILPGGQFTTAHSGNLSLSIGTTVQLRVSHSSVGSLNVLGGANPLTTNFSCFKVY